MNLKQYWAKDYTGRPFALFDASHLAVLGLVAALNLSWAWLGPHLDDNARLAVRVAIAVVLLANEAVWHLWNLTTGQWTAQNLLPFHLCSVMVYLSAFMLLTRNYAAYEFCYFLGIGGASQALLTPEAGRYGFPHVRFWTTMVSHSLLVTAPLYLTVVEGFRPVPASLVRVTAELAAYAVIVMLINRRLGSNYMFLARKPDTPSLIDVLGPWPWYIGWLGLMALAVMGLLYLPFLFF
ncbi:MAG: TIGR02206 family membrane protein [Anaerolineales bacterium]|nr:TIGR02206 family membrane protein [Anaerolineales bacterium]